MRHLPVVFCRIGLVLVLAFPAFAAGENGPKSLSAFFKPLSMTVIMGVDDGVLIDKGSADGVAPGDVMAVVKDKKKLRHPQSGKEIDILVDYQGYLVAARVKLNVSYCRVLGAVDGIKEGAKARRFENVPVYFEDSTGEGFLRFQALRQELPHLLWKDYLTKPVPNLSKEWPALVIRYTEDRLTVLNQNEKILFVQQTSSAAVVGSTSASASAATTTRTKSGTTPGYQIEQGWKEQRVALPAGEGLDALRVDDLDQDGQPEILLGFDHNLMVVHLKEGQLDEITRVPLPRRQQLVDVSALDLNGNETREVIISVLEDNRAHAKVFEFADGRLITVADIPMLLATYQPPHGGAMLVGIGTNSMLETKPQFFSMKLVDGRLAKTPIRLPGIRQPYGVAGFVDSAGAVLLAALSNGGRLQVRDDGGQVLWESPDNFGGSTRGLKIRQPGKRNLEDYETHYFLSKLERTPKGTLLVSQHEGPGPFKNNPNYKKGRLVELVWNGASLEEVSRTRPLGGMIVDFDQFDLSKDGQSEILAAVVYRKKDIFQKPVSGLVILYRP